MVETESERRERLAAEVDQSLIDWLRRWWWLIPVVPVAVAVAGVLLGLQAAP